MATKKTQSASAGNKRSKRVTGAEASAISTALIPDAVSKQSNKTKLIIGVAVVLLIALYFLRGLFIVAFVNGMPIWRLSVISQLESESGKKALEQLITTTLILQEANKERVTASDKEVDSRIKQIEDTLAKQGQNLDSVLSLQGMTRGKLVEQIKIQILVEKMIGKDIKITDKEIDDYIEQNKNLLPQNKNNSELREEVKDQIRQQKLGTKFQEWIVGLQKKAKISYVVTY